MRRYDNSNKVSYVAHLGGAFAGILVGIIVLKNRKVELWERNLTIVCIVTFVLCMIMFIIYNIVGEDFYPETSEHSDTNCPWHF